MKPNRQSWPRAPLRPDVPVVVMVTVDEEANCLDGASPEIAAARIASWGVDAIGCNCSVGPATVLTAIERMAAVTDAAAHGDAQRRHAPLRGWPQHLSLLAGVHGELCAQIHQGRRAVHRRMLRNHRAAHSRHEVGAASHRSAGLRWPARHPPGADRHGNPARSPSRSARGWAASSTRARSSPWWRLFRRAASTAARS